METISQRVDSDVVDEDKEQFHEFLRGYTDIFIKNVQNTKDYTYKNTS